MKGDYTLVGFKERATAWARACSAAVIERRKCATLFAIATPESAGVMLADTAAGSLLPADCYPNRPVIAIEHGSTRLGTKLPSSWTSDDELMTFLADNGWLSSDRLHVAGAADKVDRPDKGSPNDAAIDILAYIIDKRKGGALKAFSIGPTQMYLAYSPLAGGSMKDRFATWDELFAFVVRTKASELANSQAFTYLPIASAPTLDSSDEEIQKYLSNYQVGKTDWTTSGRQAYLAAFKNGLATIEQVCDEIGYT